jgi:hypothetical protein
MAPLGSIARWKSKNVDEQAAVERRQFWSLNITAAAAVAAAAAEHD